MLSDVLMGFPGSLSSQHRTEVGHVSRDQPLSKDLLAAMGKRFDVSGRLRNDQEYTALVPVWLAAHDISDVVISGVETLSTEHLHHLSLLAHGSGVRLWLVADHVVSAALQELAAAWPMFGMSRRGFDAHWSALQNNPTPQKRWTT